jgi:hypothetical protein
MFVAAARADRRLDQEALCAPMTRALTAGLFRQSHTPDDLSGTFRWTDTAAAVQDALNAELGGRCQRPRSCARISEVLCTVLAIDDLDGCRGRVSHAS